MHNDTEKIIVCEDRSQIETTLRRMTGSIALSREIRRMCRMYGDELYDRVNGLSLGQALENFRLWHSENIEEIEHVPDSEPSPMLAIAEAITRKLGSYELRAATNDQRQYREVVERLLCKDLDDTVEVSTSDLMIPSMKNYYESVGRIGLNSAHNTLLLPDEMTQDESGEFLQFMIGSNGSTSWAVRCEESQDNSPNVFRLSGSEHFDEEMRISHFLLMMLYIQASLGGLKFRGLHPNTMELLRMLRNDWEPVVVHDGITIWQKDNTLIHNFGGTPFSGCATNSPEQFDALVTSHGFTASPHAT